MFANPVSGLDYYNKSCYDVNCELLCNSCGEHPLAMCYENVCAQ